MAHITQHIIDTLYTDMKTILIYPAKVMYKLCINNIHLILVIILKELGDMAKTWFNDECEILIEIHLRCTVPVISRTCSTIQETSL